MPELPEVEVTRRGLLPYLKGLFITDVFWSGKNLRRPVPYGLIKKHICSNRLLDIERKAKYLILRMDNRSSLILHLGMSGKLGIFPGKTPLKKHDHFVLFFNNETMVKLNDVRRFGSVDIWPPDTAETLEEQFTVNLGIEPFSRQYSAKILKQLAANRKISIKTFLMSPELVSGLGNIYANEILFGAGIHPVLPAAEITLKQWEKIVLISRKILRSAIDAGGSTISDFLNSNGSPGYFQLQLKIYNRAGSKCVRCSRTVEKILISGRATYLCPKCQNFQK